MSDDKDRTLLYDGQPPTVAGDGASRSHLNCSLPSVPPAQNDNEDMSDTSSPPLESPVVMSYDLDTVSHDGRRRSGVVYAVTGAEITTTSADMATDDKHHETSEAAVSNLYFDDSFKQIAQFHRNGSRGRSRGRNGGRQQPMNDQ